MQHKNLANICFNLGLSFLATEIMHLCEQIGMPNLALGREVPVGLHGIFHNNEARLFLYSTDIRLDHSVWHACNKSRRRNECHQRNKRCHMQTHHDAAETMCLKIVPPGNENNRASYESRLPPLTCEPYMLWTDEEGSRPRLKMGRCFRGRN